MAQISKQQKAAAVLEAASAQFMCPLCNGSVRVDGGGLLCGEGHRYDMAKNGYINFLSRPASDRYGKAGFTSRTELYRHGFLSPVFDWCVQQVVDWQRCGVLRVLDAGCGEGSPLHLMVKQLRAHRVKIHPVGIDISKQAVHVAAREYPGSTWLVGDLSRPPLQPGVFDVLLNLFAPANYDAFSRLLVPGGLLIKAAPGPDHLKELRSLVAKKPIQAVAEDGETVDHFCRNTVDASRSRCKGTFPLDWQGAQQALIRSSPLAWDADDTVLQGAEEAALTEVTYDVILLQGSQPPSAQ